jgi:hypothetical protein
MTLRERLQAIKNTPIFRQFINTVEPDIEDTKHFIITHYCKGVLVTLAMIASNTHYDTLPPISQEKILIDQLQSFLESTWLRIKGTILCYTSTDLSVRHDINDTFQATKKILFSLAELVAKEKQLDKLQVLMPTLKITTKDLIEAADEDYHVLQQTTRDTQSSHDSQAEMKDRVAKLLGDFFVNEPPLNSMEIEDNSTHEPHDVYMNTSNYPTVDPADNINHINVNIETATSSKQDNNPWTQPETSTDLAQAIVTECAERALHKSSNKPIIEQCVTRAHAKKAAKNSINEVIEKTNRLISYIDLENLVNSHVLSEDHSSLHPVDFVLNGIEEADWENNRALVFYTAKNDYDKFFLSAKERKQLLHHSKLMRNIVDTKERISLVESNEDNLYGQIILLCKKLYLYSKNGIGNEEHAGEGAWLEIQKFVDYYHKLSNKNRQNIPENTTIEIHKIRRLVNDPVRHKDDGIEMIRLTDIQYCLDSRRSSLMSTLKDNENKLESICIEKTSIEAISDSLREQLREQVMQLKHNIKQSKYTANNRLPITHDLLIFYCKGFKHLIEIDNIIRVLENFQGDEIEKIIKNDNDLIRTVNTFTYQDIITLCTDLSIAQFSPILQHWIKLQWNEGFSSNYRGIAQLLAVLDMDKFNHCLDTMLEILEKPEYKILSIKMYSMIDSDFTFQMLEEEKYEILIKKTLDKIAHLQAKSQIPTTPWNTFSSRSRRLITHVLFQPDMKPVLNKMISNNLHLLLDGNTDLSQDDFIKANKDTFLRILTITREDEDSESFERLFTLAVENIDDLVTLIKLSSTADAENFTLTHLGLFREKINTVIRSKEDMTKLCRSVLISPRHATKNNLITLLNTPTDAYYKKNIEIIGEIYAEYCQVNQSADAVIQKLTDIMCTNKKFDLHDSKLLIDITTAMITHLRQPDTSLTLKPNSSDSTAIMAAQTRKKVDPITGKPSTSDNAISSSEFRMRQKIDPETGEPSTAYNAICLLHFSVNFRLDSIEKCIKWITTLITDIEASYYLAVELIKAHIVEDYKIQLIDILVGNCSHINELLTKILLTSGNDISTHEKNLFILRSSTKISKNNTSLLLSINNHHIKSMQDLTDLIKSANQRRNGPEELMRYWDIFLKEKIKTLIKSAADIITIIDIFYTKVNSSEISFPLDGTYHDVEALILNEMYDHQITLQDLFNKHTAPPEIFKEKSPLFFGIVAKAALYHKSITRKESILTYDSTEKTTHINIMEFLTKDITSLSQFMNLSKLWVDVEVESETRHIENFILANKHKIISLAEHTIDLPYFILDILNLSVPLQNPKSHLVRLHTANNLFLDFKVNDFPLNLTTNQKINKHRIISFFKLLNDHLKALNNEGYGIPSESIFQSTMSILSPDLSNETLISILDLCNKPRDFDTVLRCINNQKISKVKHLIKLLENYQRHMSSRDRFHVLLYSKPSENLIEIAIQNTELSDNISLTEAMKLFKLLSVCGIRPWGALKQLNIINEKWFTDNITDQDEYLGLYFAFIDHPKVEQSYQQYQEADLKEIGNELQIEEILHDLLHNHFKRIIFPEQVVTHLKTYKHPHVDCSPSNSNAKLPAEKNTTTSVTSLMNALIKLHVKRLATTDEKQQYHYSVLQSIIITDAHKHLCINDMPTLCRVVSYIDPSSLCNAIEAKLIDTLNEITHYVLNNNDGDCTLTMRTLQKNSGPYFHQYEDEVESPLVVYGIYLPTLGYYQDKLEMYVSDRSQMPNKYKTQLPFRLWGTPKNEKIDTANHLISLIKSHIKFLACAVFVEMCFKPDETQDKGSDTKLLDLPDWSKSIDEKQLSILVTGELGKIFRQIQESPIKYIFKEKKKDQQNLKP